MDLLGGGSWPHLKNYFGKSVAIVMLCFGGALLGLVVAAEAASAEPVRASGVTESVHDITMSVADAGTIQKIFYSVGDQVKKNQSILELDNSREKLEMERRKLVWESKAELVSATKRVETLGAVVNSSKSLYETTKSISKEEVDMQQLEYDMAVSELKQLEIAEEREAIEYGIAAENYQRRILKSPIDGVIVKLVSDVGEYVAPEKPFVQIVTPQKCYMVCQIEEGLGRSLKKGAKVSIEVMAGAEWLPKSATVVFVSPVVDQASGLLEVKLEFNNSDGRVRPGVPGVMLVDVPST
jgi:RND family efflux transporter MFP subunit